MPRVVIWLIGLLAALLAAIALLLRISHGGADIPLEIAKGLVNLAVAVAVTGILTYLINRRSQEQARHDERTKTLTDALQELKSAFEEANQVRFHLGTNTSPRTFIEQIPNIGRTRTRLQRVQRGQFVLGTQVDELAQAMLDYLSRIGREYRRNYPQILHDALLEDAAREKVRSGKTTKLEMFALPHARFPSLYAFIDHDEWRRGSFHVSYVCAKNLLQEWLGHPQSPDPRRATGR